MQGSLLSVLVSALTFHCHSGWKPSKRQNGLQEGLMLQPPCCLALSYKVLEQLQPGQWVAQGANNQALSHLTECLQVIIHWFHLNTLPHYICSWRGFKRRLMMYSAHALSLVKVCDVLVVLFKAVVTFHLASAGVVRAVWMPVDRLLSKGFTSTPYYFSFHLWFVIFERAVFAFSIRQTSLSLCPLFLFFFLVSGSFFIGFWWNQTVLEPLDWLSRYCLIQ